jgi:hypothetical protein
MIFKFDGTTYSIKFYHNAEGRITYVYLHDLTNGKPTDTGAEPIQVDHGSAVCHPNDQFTKEIGRKIALKKLLYKRSCIWMGHRHKRAIFWAKYFAWIKKKYKQNKELVYDYLQ